MKIKLITLALTVSGMISFGQTPFYTEDFSDAAKVDTTWNLYDYNGGTNNYEPWMVVQNGFNYPGAANGSLRARDVDDEFENYAYSITPRINCTGKNNVYLSFTYYQPEANSSYEGLNIHVSNNGTDWTSNWVNFFSVLNYTPSPVMVVNLNISSMAANQDTVYIRFGASWSLSLHTPHESVFIDDIELKDAVCATTGTLSSAVAPHIPCTGGSVSLNATTGTGNNYIWHKDNTTIAGANAASYNATIFGTYDAYIIEPNGCSVKTNSVVVTGGLANVSITPSGPTTFCEGGSVNLAPSGLAYNMYTILKDGYPFGSYTTTQSGVYKIKGCYPGCSVESNPVTVTVNPKPVVSIIPTPASSCAGSPFTFNSTVSTTVTYQWKKQSTNIAGATSSSYTTSSSPSSSSYSLIVTDANGCSNTATTSHTVVAQPTATLSLNGTVPFCNGSGAIYNVSTTPGATYQWLKNGVAITGATYPSYAVTTAGSYRVNVTNSQGCTRLSSSQAVTVSGTTNNAVAKALTSANVCSGSQAVLTATGANGNVQWRLNGTNIPGATSTVYSTNVDGNYDAVITATCGTVTTNSVAITASAIVPANVITSNGFHDYCKYYSGGLTLTAQASGSGITYQWQLNGVNVSGTGQSFVATNFSGPYTCLISSACTTVVSNPIGLRTSNVDPVITTAPSAYVCGPDSILLSTSYPVAISSYSWAGPGGFTSTSPSIYAKTSGTYTLSLGTACPNGPATNNISVTVHDIPTGVITATGGTAICGAQSVPLIATTSCGNNVQWQFNGSNLAGETNKSILANQAGTYSCLISDSCGSSISNQIIITGGAAPAAVISNGGITTICIGSNVPMTANAGTGYTYQWQLNGSDISGETNATYSATSAGNYTCVVTNACASVTSNIISLSQGISPTASISANGPATFCDTDSLLLSAQTGTGYSYQWQLNGNNISGATGADYLAFAQGSYTCVVIAACGSVTSNIITTTVNITPAQPGLITAISQACNPVNNVPVSISAVPGATSYHWYATNPTITFNGPVDGLTASANLLPSTNSGYNIWVEAINNGCVSQPRIKFIRRILSVPAAVMGNTQVCVPQTGVSYSCAAVTGADDYLWTVPSGVNITSGQGTNAIVVSFSGNYTTGSICVSARLNCGYATTAKCKTITAFSSSTVAITNLSGPVYLCPGTTYNYSVNNLSGATFNWTVPANVSINSGQGSNAITINVAPGFSSGNICVNASNTCATSPTSCKGVATSAPARPNSISGVLNGVCALTQSYTASAVTGATAYTWSVTGGNILSGQNTQTVNVQWNSSGTNGSLNVAAVNGCGAGLVRSVGTTLKPAVAAAISGPAVLCAGSLNNVFSIPPAAGASTYAWQITPAGSGIASGQGTTSINATWGTSSGTVLCTPSNACGSSKTKTYAVTVNCRIGNDEVPAINNSMELTAYPNPFNDKLNIQLTSDVNENVNIQVADIAGRIISKHLINANTVYSLGEHLPGGIYFVTAKQNYTVKTIRVVKNQ